MVLLPAVAHAQAWVLLAGEGTVSVVYHHLFVEDHVFARGDRHDVGQIRTHALTADFDYGLTDRWSLRAQMPYVAAKYAGGFPHRFPGQAPADFEQLDNTGYHSGLQDLRVEARYGAMEFPFAITPFVAFGVPTHEYEYFAHSAIGLHMKELQLGTYLGAYWGRWSAQGRASFGIYESVLGRRRNRTNLDAEVGWTAGRNVRVFLFETSQISHGGFDLPFEDLPRLAAEPWFPNHDQLVRAHFLNVGAGAVVGLTRAMSLQASLTSTVAGRNTHAAKYGFTFGANWGFGGRHPHHAATRRP